MRAVEHRVNELNQPQPAMLMLKMRRYESEFMLRGEGKDGDQLVDCEAEFETVLGQANLPPEVTSSILALIRAYKADFLALITRQTLRDPTTSSRSTSAFIHPMLMTIVAAADARSCLADAGADHIRRRSIWIIALTTTIVGLLAFLFDQRIAKTVASMTSAMRQLARGDSMSCCRAVGEKTTLGTWIKGLRCLSCELVKRRRPISMH
ncbi:hypothetical protein [Bradyrhizobium vignae]|uniref:Uncharacterized protein n=1 Tax=Bradyrhizobium vignae TaxID=1549949 RepID=A0ABS4A1T4_9BRAD|nr:hypothetical protein [Bradyrhizobium vignae]MBP0114348.1 hypothetical protein [Bradyrhizobium vignae]